MSNTMQTDSALLLLLAEKQAEIVALRARVAELEQHRTSDASEVGNP